MLNSAKLYLYLAVPTMSLCSLRSAPGWYYHKFSLTLKSRREERPHVFDFGLAWGRFFYFFLYFAT